MIKNIIVWLSLVVILMALLSGSASANGACIASDGTVFGCGDTVTKRCTLNGTMTCEGDCLVIGSGQIRIYGDGHCIKGDGTGTGIYNPGSSNFFELHDLEIKNFETGIRLRNAAGTTIFDYIVDNSSVHNNTIGMEIDDMDPRKCIIEQCKFHNNTRGIYVHGGNGTNIKITDNNVYDNTVSGIRLEATCTDCEIAYNVISENGNGLDMNTSDWVLEHNLITNNRESGILVVGSDTTFRYNTVGNNRDGIQIAEGSENITFERNAFCNNSDRDVFVNPDCNNISGDENACEMAENHNDTGTTGCTYPCTGCISESGIVYRCGSIVTESCTFNADMTCPVGDGLIVWASGTVECPLVIDGAEHGIDGIAPGDHNRNGIYSPGAHDYVTIKNLGVMHFQGGIKLGSYYGEPIEYNVIANCTVHDNGEPPGNPNAFYTRGISTIKAKNCIITYCEIYNNTGDGDGSCEDGGRGLLLYGPGGNNIVTYNRIYNNGMAGIYSKMQSKYNYVAYNEVYGNGKQLPEEDTFMPGGIVLACRATNYWIVEHNNIYDNTGSGISVGGSNDIIRYNNITNTTASILNHYPGNGIYIGRYSSNHTLTSNTVCSNEAEDIRVQQGCIDVIGNNNTCDTTSNYDDTGTTGCTYSCGMQEPKPSGDLNGDGKVTPADAVIALEMAIRGEYSEEADVGGDHKVTSLDALMILQKASEVA